MPFKSQAELDSMIASDPKKAVQFIQDAKSMGKPVVSTKNPGYADAAKRRLAKQLRERSLDNKGESYK